MAGASIIALVVVTAVTTERAAATPISWASNVDGSFNDGTKWTGDTVPGAGDDVTINTGTSGSPDTVTSSTDNTINSLTTGAYDTLATTGGTFRVNNGGNNAGTISIGDNSTFEIGGAMANSGMITVNATTHNADLRFMDGASLTGGGTVSLSDSANNRIWGVGNSGTETVTNVDNTIEGAGQFGIGSSIEFINQAGGVINASGTNALTVTPTTNGTATSLHGNAGFVNQGLMEATNTGGLVLNGGAFNNNGGTIQAVGAGNNVYLRYTTVMGGVVYGSGGGLVETQSGTYSTLDGSSQGAVTLQGTYQASNNSTTYILGTLDNLGTLSGASSGNSTDIRFADGAKLTGGGTIALSDFIQNRIYGAANSGTETVTNVDNTIQGAGQLGASSSIEFINQAGGTINASGTNSLTILPTTNAAVVSANGGGFVNQGMLEATGAGGLIINVGQVNNDGGTILASGAGHNVYLQNNATISGGTINGNGGLVETVSGYSATLDGASQGTLTIKGTYQATNNSTTYLSGTIDNQGMVSVASTGNNATLRMADGTVLQGGGTVSLSDDPHNLIYGAANSGAETVTNHDNTIRGAGTIGANSSFEFINQAGGVIDANGTNSLIVNPTGNGTVATPNGGGFVNQGLMEATNTGGLVLVNGVFNNNGGTIEAVGAGNGVYLQNSVTVAGGTLFNNGGVMQTSSGYTASLDGASQGQITIQGTYEGVNNSITRLFGTINNTGTILANASTHGTYLELADGTSLTGGGTIMLSDSTLNRLYGVANSGAETVTNVDNTIEGAGAIGYSASFEFINGTDGVIDANGTASLTVMPTTNGTVVGPNNGGFVNQGIMKATGAGGLYLNGGVFNNQTGLIEAIGSGNNVYLQGNTTVAGGMLTSSGGGMVETQAGQIATLDGDTLGQITNTGTYQGSDNSTTYVAGTLHNTGTFLLNATGHTTDLRFADGAMLTGGGTVTLSDNGLNRIWGAANSGAETVTNVDNTIQGAGTIGANSSMEFVNQATIDANGTNALIIYPTHNTGLVTANNGGFVNQGTLEATNTGGLILSTGMFNNDGGTIEAVGTGNNVYLQSNVTIAGGMLAGSGGGLVETVASQTVSLDGSTVGQITLTGGYLANNNSTTYLSGTFDNLGTFTLDSTGSSTDLRVADGTMLTGGGTIVLSDDSHNRIWGAANTGTEVLTNVDNTIEGAGQIGYNSSIKIVNGGTIDANGTNALVIVPTNSGAVGTQLVNQAGGILEASGAGGLSINNGMVDNQGSEIALGSTITYQSGATTLNNSGGTLTGGSWGAYSLGGGATVSINGSPVVTDAANIVLSGAGSVFQVRNGNTNTFTPLEDSLTTIAATGQLQILNNRDYTTNTASNDISNAGSLSLGGGTFTAKDVTSSGLVFGYGTITTTSGTQLANSGTVNASGGTLTVTPGISGTSGDVTIDSGAGLDISPASTGSTVATLNDSGAMNLGANNVTVYADYNNANFGTGNSFDKHANVSTIGGQILAAGTTQQTLTGDVTGGTTATPTMTFGNVHVGDSVTQSYQVANTGSGGPSLRGAIQTAGAGNITSGALSGSGVTAGNYGPVAQSSATGDLSVTYTPTAAGALAGQTVHVANNFDNVGEQTLSFTGAAYDYANPTVNNAPVAFGNHHIGDSVSQNLSISNSVTSNAAYQEGLDASAGGTTGGATTNGGSFNLLAAGNTDASSIAVGIDTSSAGTKSGTVAVNFTSDGAGTSGLAPTSLGSQDVTVTGAVYRYAAPSVAPNPVTFANVRVGGTDQQALAVSNTAANDGYSEKLDAQVGGATGDAAASGSISLLGPQASDNTSLMVGLDTSTAGHKTGTATVSLQSDGTGTSGLATTALASQTVNISGDVYRTAVGQTATPVNLGNVHVNDTLAGSLSVTNTAANDGYSEKLDASISGTSGDIAGHSGSVSLLAAQQTDNGSLSVGLDTGSAGAKSGTVTVAYQSNGIGTSGLSTIGVGSQTVTVTGGVYNLASSSTIAPVNFGVVHVGDGGGSITDSLSIANTAPAGAYSEGLDSSFGGFSGTGGAMISTSGTITNLAAGSTDNSSMTVTLDTSAVGNVSGTLTVHQDSNGTIDGLANTALPDQTPAVTAQVANATVVRYANPQVNNAPIDFGNVRQGTVLTPQGVSITNNDPNDGFSESLIGNVVGTSGTGIIATGGFGPPTGNPEVGPSATDSTSITASIDTSSAGAKSGNAIVDFKSDGTMFNGGTITDLGNTNVAVQGAVYRVANPTLNTPSVTLAARVGDASPSANVSVTNTSPDAYTEGLDAGISTASAGFTTGGSVTNLAAQGTDASSLNVSLDTSTSGSFSGNATVAYTSNGQIDNATPMGVGSGDVTLDGKVYQTASASVTPTVNFGIVHVGDTVTAQSINVANTASGALTDVVTGSIASVSGPFTKSGTLGAGVAAGTNSNALQVGLNTSAAGAYNGNANLALASHDSDLADVSLATTPVALMAQINQYAKGAIVDTGGSGTFSSSGPNYLLDFGTITQGAADPTASLAILNDVSGPADNLSGNFTMPVLPSDLALNGFLSFSGLAAGSEYSGLNIALDTATPNFFDISILLDLSGSNASGYFASLPTDPQLTLELRGHIVAGGPPPSNVPEPGTLFLLGGGLAGLYAARRRKKKK